MEDTCLNSRTTPWAICCYTLLLDFGDMVLADDHVLWVILSLLVLNSDRLQPAIVQIDILLRGGAHENLHCRSPGLRCLRLSTVWTTYRYW